MDYFDQFDRSDCAVTAEESIGRHVLDLGVAGDDVGEAGLLDFCDHFGRVGIFEPKPVSVADAAELQSGDGGSEFAEHGVRQFDLTQHADVGIDVVDAVEALLDDESIHLVVEYFFEGRQPLQPETYSQSVIIGNPVISVPVSVDSKQVEVSAHHLCWNIPQLVHIIQSPLLGQREGEPFEDGVDPEVGESVGVADQQVEQVDLLHSDIIVVDCLVGMRDVGMPDSVDSGRKLSQNGGVSAIIIPLVVPHILLEMGWSKQVGKVVIHADLLDQSDHIVAGTGVDLFV